MLANLRLAPEQNLEEEAARAKAASDQLTAHTAGLKAFYRHRELWSWFLISCIALTLLFQIAITVAVGLGSLDFHLYAWFLPLVISENFVQIIGLALIVVNFLFNKESMSAWLKPR